MSEQRDFPSFLLYCFGFLLVCEWIWPVRDLVDSTNIWVFVFFLLFSFFITYLRVSLLVSFLLKGIVIVYLLHGLYFEGSFLHLDWFFPLFQDIRANIAIVFSANIPDISNPFRSLLFFIFLWLMTYLLHYWMIQRRKILLFFIMTVAYIAVLDTFTPYDATKAIVRTVIIGFLSLGLLTFCRLKEREKMEGEGVFFHKWLLPLSAMLGLSLLVGYSLPKPESIWPDPVPYFQTLGERDGEKGAIQRVGYGTDDSRLGGPFVSDSTVVFRTEVESEHYWKVETKDVYTGKGWVQSIQGADSILFSQNRNAPISSFEDGGSVTKSVESSRIYQMDEYSHIIYPLGLKSIESDLDASFQLDPAIEKIYTFYGGQPVILSSYEVTFEKPTFNLDGVLTADDASGLNRDFLGRYTQLPDSLPERVKELAADLTKGQNNWFDKAKSIERYLHGSRFSYDTKNVLIPGERDDYVDQFLFESRKGYCDNFSTSMVTLLRSLNIPARWVKGYTAGDFRGAADDLFMYEITNDHAHSWVEVYFPGAGWVPFEPTPGFTANVSYQTENTAGNPAESTASSDSERIQPQKEETQPQQNIGDPAKKQGWYHLKGLGERFRGWLIAGAMGMAALAYFLLRLGVKWLPYCYIWRFKRRRAVENFPEAYLILLKQLQRCGINREAGQTLREYAVAVDRYFSGDEMMRLTMQYERYLYGSDKENGPWDEIMKLWEYLIKKTSA